MSTDYTPLRKYACASQLVAIDALAEHGSRQAAAEALGITPDALRTRLRRLRENAAKRGYLPKGPTEEVPLGYAVKGTSTLLREDGTVQARWVKTDRSLADRYDELLDAMRAEFQPLPEIPLVRSHTTPWAQYLPEDLLVCIPIGDPHIGLYSWALETGNDFDLQIAERNMLAAVQELIERAPAAEECLIINLGDFFHSDNLQNRTMRSGHALDVDGRWPKVLHVGMRIMRRAIDAALSKFPKVKVINAIGNHDDHTSVFLTVALDEIYALNPRVNIGRPYGHEDRTQPPPPVPFHYHRHGQVLIGVTHGDKAKGKSLGPIMSAAVPKMWGETTHRVWHCGHVHHLSRLDLHGCHVETHRTLAARDAYAVQYGYNAPRDMLSIYYHREEGEVGRVPISLRAILKGQK